MKIDSIFRILWKSLFGLILLANVAYGGATLTVNWVGPGEACDNNLTLAEAAHLGRGGFGRALTNAERNQISGGNFVAAPLPPECAGIGWAVVNGLGPNDADDIVFAVGAGATINYGITLGKNDDIDGNSSGVKVILDGSSQPSGTRGIDIEQNSGSQVRNLVIRNFPSTGIFAQRMNGAKFEGLDIFGNSANGISLGFDGNVNSRNVTIGGDQPQHRNRIFSNGADGIFIGADPAHDRMEQAIFILNNLIGTSNGVTDNGNGGRGISLINATGVYIGDLTGATRNIISGNNNDGIALEGAGAVSNHIIANFIGTTESAGAPLGNSSSGIALLNGTGSTANSITTAPNYIGQVGLGNVISANNFGIFIADPNTSLNRIQGNLIGTNVGGNTDLGNALDGIYFVNGTLVNTIGGTNAGEGNLIAFNRNGIRADSGIRNSFRRNRIFSNDLLGIDLAPVGVTQNDAGDGDSGPNNLQNFPIITYVNAQASSVTLEGTLNSTPNQTYTLEFFGNSGVDTSGFGEGRNFLGSTQVTTDASGNASFFGVNFAVSSTTVGSWVSATATNTLGDTSEYSVARNICAYLRTSPVSILAPLGGISTSFTYITSTGCTAPTAVSNSSWITVGSVGSATVNFTVAANPGPPRDGLINVSYNSGTGQSTTSFLVSQNNGCTYSINATGVNVPIEGGSSTINVVTSSGCTWGATSNTAWVTITGGSTGTGSGTVSFTVAPNTGPIRTGTMTIAGQTLTVNQIGLSRRARFDFDGDGKTDISIFRPSVGEWWYLKSSNGGNAALQFGQSTDKLTPGDFTGDGKADIAFWRPATGEWFVLRSENLSFYSFQFGSPGDIPAPADYDGDGKTDVAVFRPSTATWYISKSSGGTTIQQFGASTDFPVAADYDGDGKADLAIWRPNGASGAEWWYQKSSIGQTTALQFGSSTDKAVPADYTGDGKADIAFFRPSTGFWFVLRSEDLSFYSFPFGSTGDMPVAGDYDGDGKTDPAVFRPSTQTWYLNRTAAGNLITTFGIANDKPVPNAFVP
jgi:FG-GAP-like repeat/Putative binding domain, N-terminal